MGAGGIEAAVALLTGVGLAAFDYVLALTVETAHWNEGPGLPFHKKEPPWHSFQWKYRSVTSPTM
jgi:hypothetical protein